MKFICFIFYFIVKLLLKDYKTIYKTGKFHRQVQYFTKKCPDIPKEYTTLVSLT